MLFAGPTGCRRRPGLQKEWQQLEKVGRRGGTTGTLVQVGTAAGPEKGGSESCSVVVVAAMGGAERGSGRNGGRGGCRASGRGVSAASMQCRSRRRSGPEGLCCCRKGQPDEAMRDRIGAAGWYLSRLVHTRTTRPSVPAARYCQRALAPVLDSESSAWRRGWEGGGKEVRNGRKSRRRESSSGNWGTGSDGPQKPRARV